MVGFKAKKLLKLTLSNYCFVKVIISAQYPRIEFKDPALAAFVATSTRQRTKKSVKQRSLIVTLTDAKPEPIPWRCLTPTVGYPASNCSEERNIIVFNHRRGDCELAFGCYGLANPIFNNFATLGECRSLCGPLTSILHYYQRKNDDGTK